MTTLDVVRTKVSELAQGPVPDDLETSLFESGVIDSFGVIELIGRLEEAFGIKVPDADMIPTRFDTLAKIVAYIDEKRGH